jgi:hypothetical protein
VQELVCVDDVDQFGREVTSDLEALVQDVYHMMIEDPGSNLDLPDRGIGIYSLLSGTTSNMRTIVNRIDQQLPLDDRIDASSTTVTQNPDGSYSINVQLDVDGTVVGIVFDYSAAQVLSLTSWGTG